MECYKKEDLTDSEIEQEAERIRAACGCEVESLPFVGAFIWNDAKRGAARTIDRHLNSTKLIVEQDKDIELYGSASNAIPPNDPYFKLQWALSDKQIDAHINAQQGWEEYLTDNQGGDPNGPSTIVAVIDAGVDYTHPDLKDMMWVNPAEIPNNGKDDDDNGIVDDIHGANCASSKCTGDPMDIDGHGTHCAGIIGATYDNGEGIAGLAGPAKGKVKILACKFGEPKGFPFSAALRCMNYAISMGATILSNSWGSPNMAKCWPQILRNTVDQLFVFGAGNGGDDEIGDALTPGCTSMGCCTRQQNLLCVAASDPFDKKDAFSNYGKEFVHVFAPGVDIYSTWLNVPSTGNSLDPMYKSSDGTSMACPLVAGLAALIATMHNAIHATEIKTMIENNVNIKDQYRDLVSSGGLIDVEKTIRSLKQAKKGL